MFEIRKEFKRAHPDIAEKLNAEEYNFLTSNEHLDDNIVLLGLGGSYAYGTNVSTKEHTSDIDIRGVALNTKEEILGLENFEQFENRETDTVIYGVKKFFNLLSACNPNIVEIAGLRNEDYIYISPIGQLILDNKEIFLSQRAAHSFGGYANAQLRRVQTATARDRLPEITKQGFIGKSMESAVANIMSNHDLDRYGDLTINVNEQTGQLVTNVNFKDIPVGEFVDIMNTMKQVQRDYDSSVGARNRKDDVHLNKHAQHLVRLYRMGIEILRDHEINTYREDRNELLEIRNGSFMRKDGLLSDEFYQMINSYEKELSYWKENTTLPKTPDYKKIEDLLIRINSMALDQFEEKEKLLEDRSR